MPRNRSPVAINNNSPILKIFTNTLRSVCVNQAFGSERVEVVQFTRNVLNQLQNNDLFSAYSNFCFELFWESKRKLQAQQEYGKVRDTRHRARGITRWIITQSGMLYLLLVFMLRHKILKSKFTMPTKFSFSLDVR